MARIATKTYTENAVTISFIDGTKIEMGLSDMPDNMTDRLAIHGLLQKLGDSYASADDVPSAIERCQSVAEALRRGEWTVGRASTGGTILAEALAKATGRTVEDATAAIAKLSDADKAAMQKHPAVKSALAEIRAARAKAAAKGTKAADLGTLFD